MRIDVSKEQQYRDEKYNWKRCSRVTVTYANTLPHCHRSYRSNENNRYHRYSLSSSSPETMSFSSPEHPHSSEDDDSESDVNPLLMHAGDRRRDCGRKDSTMFDDKNPKYESGRDPSWYTIPDHSWRSSNYSIDQGYHSMEPLTRSYTTVALDTGISNANVQGTVALSNDYGRLRSCKATSGSMVQASQMVLALPINNNADSTDTLWHSSAWSAPRKSRSYSSCVGPADDVYRSIHRQHPRSAVGLQRTKSDSSAWTSGSYNESVNHLYINKSADFYSISESASDLSCSWDDSEWPNPYGKSENLIDLAQHFGQAREGALEDFKNLRSSGTAIDHRNEPMQNASKMEFELPPTFNSNGNLVKNPTRDSKRSGGGGQTAMEAENRQSGNPPTDSLSTKLSPVVRKSIDVNMASRTFNNFSISSDKQKEILRLLQERRRNKDANICEIQAKNEAKILNTGKGLLKSTCPSSTRRHCVGRTSYTRWSSGHPEIADGLVLEKVRYDPTWRRRNSTLCSSGDAFKQFCRDVRVKNPLSAPIEPRKRDEPLCPAQPVRQDSSLQESPTENATPVDKTVDLNRNETAAPAGDAPKTATAKSTEDAKSLSKRFAELLEGFDVYDIDTTMPTIDWEAMEAHLTRAAEEDDWAARRRNDREEIRRRLAFGTDAEDYYYMSGDRITKKPSLTTRLQSGMNLQICFMNETASDSDEGHSDNEAVSTSSSMEEGLTETKCLLQGASTPNNNSHGGLSTANSDRILPSSPTEITAGQTSGNRRQRPSFFFPKQRSWRLRSKHKHETACNPKEANGAKEVEDFYARHARLQAEARLALTQAKEMAKMQMEIERQKCKKSPISEIVGLSFPNGRHSRLSRQILNSMNIAQLQVIVNDLHTHIETLNDDLVRLLLSRDDLHMEQDSMLVDIEDLTRYLGAKEAGQHPLQSVIASK